uniref:Putative secreted protein n=1 Tax=Amblyomma americanum TaxID=6943 RepID=A0A0C9SEV0_AMBAM
MPLRFYAFVFLWIFMVIITGVHGSAKTPSERPRLTLTSVFVTEFLVDTTSSPPFENFTVFKKFNLSRTLLITKIWDNFTEYVFRKCKQDIRNVTKLVYTRRMNHVAHAVGEFDIIKLLQ